MSSSQVTTRRMLLVDDQPAFLQLAKSLLSGHAGIEVIGEASNGHEALHLLERYRPDLVICDLQMPDVNGFEVTRRLRETVPGTRVIIVSGIDDPQYPALARSAGAEGFLSKNHLTAEAVLRILEGS